MSTFLHRVWAALDGYEGPDALSAAGPGTAHASCALGVLIHHVVRSFAQDRRLLASWLDEGAGRPS